MENIVAVKFPVSQLHNPTQRLITHILHSSLIPLSNSVELLLFLCLWPLMLKRGPFGRVDVPRHRRNILWDVRIDVPGKKKEALIFYMYKNA